MSTKSNDNAAGRGGNLRIGGREVAIRKQILDKPEARTRLFQRHAVAEETGDGWRRRRHAVRTRASAQACGLSAAQIPGNHAQISRSNDPGAKSLEIRYRLAESGLRQGCHT